MRVGWKGYFICVNCLNKWYMNADTKVDWVIWNLSTLSFLALDVLEFGPSPSTFLHKDKCTVIHFAEAAKVCAHILMCWNRSSHQPENSHAWTGLSSDAEGKHLRVCQGSLTSNAQKPQACFSAWEEALPSLLCLLSFSFLYIFNISLF